MTDVIYADAAFGVNSQNPDNTVSLQSAVAAATAANAILQLPAGVLNISSVVSGNDACIIRGAGSGGGGWTQSGTIINQTNAQSGVFAFTCIGGVVFQDFAISMPENGTGVGIFVQSGVENNLNRGTRIQNVRTEGGGIGVSLFHCSNYTISDCFLRNFSQHGVELSTDQSLPDIGDSMIRGNTIWDFNLTGTSCIFANPQGGLSIIGNKLLGAEFGVLLSSSSGPTGTLIVSGNSIEAQTVSHIYCRNGGQKYGYVLIDGNQMQSYDGPTFQTSICLCNDATQFLDDCIISNNIIRDQPIMYDGIYLGGVTNAIVIGNVIDLAGSSTKWITKGNCSNIVSANNITI